MDTAKSAAAIDLVYTTDAIAGISRKQKNGGWTYVYNGKTIKDKETLDRIKKLVIPPAWQNVWISPIANSHLLVTGTDAMGRKQYKYHTLWTTLRNQTKFSHLYEFGKALPTIRKQLEKHMALPGLPHEKVMATIIALLQCTCIRIGSNEYEKLYGSFGLTTMKDKHVQINGSEVRFEFKGKKGVYHKINLKSKKLARIVQQCRDIPGKELFQYYDDNGKRKAVDSGMVNSYIKTISGGDFTAKDFRTWAGTLQAIEAFKEKGTVDGITATKKAIVEVLDMVAEKLGNTRAVCKKYYVHPIVIDHYTNNTLHTFLEQKNTAACDDSIELSTDEKIMMKILKSTATSIIV